MPVEVVIGVAAALVAAALVYAFMRAGVAEARAGAKAAESMLASGERRFGELIEAQRRETEGRIAALRAEFSSLAASTLEGKAKSLAEQNAAQVKPLFDQLRIKFDEFRRAADDAQKANIELGSTLQARIEDVGQKAAGLGRQAEEFVAALRGGSKVQGNWGEGILRKVLEDAGLRPGENFVEQEGAQGAGLPDVTIFDGAHRKLLVDAKVNITDFIAAVNASRAGDAAEAERLMKEHAKRVKLQVDALAARSYPEKMKRADKDPESVYSSVVVMFMPSEATYFAAVNADPSLVAHANAKKIVLATPQMLYGYVLLFKMALDRIEVARNQEEIAKRAKQIVDRMDDAFSALEKVGKSLSDAQNSYRTALMKLGIEDGAQNVLVPAKALAKLAGCDGEAKSASMRQIET
ncbi:MAG: DNA recombination protein RmuC [Kiritimatiellae bacterium]|nr:DNA recombination protein RmuC [Kiritimatiellia bacterium]